MNEFLSIETDSYTINEMDARDSDDFSISMEISDNVLALDQGKSIAFGSPKEIQNNKQVIDSYLGTYDAA